MNLISIPFRNKHLMFEYRDTTRPFGDTKKNMDLQIIKEIFEENVYQLTEDKLNGSRVVIDIGGHLGAFSLMAAAMGANVIAFEPNADNAKLLNSNKDINNFENVIKVIPKAVYNSNTPIKMDNFYSDSRVQELSGIATEASKVSVEDPTPAFLAHTVDFEDFCKDIPEIDFLKMDCEWSEYNIIPALSIETMKKIKFMAIEFHGTTKTIFGEMISHLSKGYRIEILGHHDRGGFIWARRY